VYSHIPTNFDRKLCHRPKVLQVEYESNFADLLDGNAYMCTVCFSQILIKVAYINFKINGTLLLYLNF